MEPILAKKIEEERRLEDEVNKKLTFAMFMVYSSLALGFYVCFDLFTDDEVLAYSAPPASSLNAPIRPKKLTDLSAIEQKDFIIDSVRKYLRAKYPKNSGELRSMYEYVKNHSEGNERSDYISRLSDLEEVARSIDKGSIINLYIKDVDMISIGFNKQTSLWSIEIPARKVKFIGLLGDEKTEPLITITLKLVNPTRTNDGYIVTDYKETVVDPVTKETIILNK